MEERFIKMQGKYNPGTGKVDVKVLAMSDYKTFCGVNPELHVGHVRVKCDGSRKGFDDFFIIDSGSVRKAKYARLGITTTLYLPVWMDRLHDWKCEMTLEEWAFCKRFVRDFNSGLIR